MVLFTGEYMVALRRDFVEFLKYSFSFKQNNEPTSVIERFSDKYHNVGSGVKGLTFPWDRLPSELRPKSKGIATKRKRDQTGQESLKRQSIDVSRKYVYHILHFMASSIFFIMLIFHSRLEELAKLEETTEEEGDGIKEEKEDEEEENEENVEGVEDEDDEMDDGTDYVNSYFDNGESYFDDEDDNLDDGPVY